MEDPARNADERNDENEFEWIDDVVAYLRSGNVEAEDEGQGEAEDGGAAENRIYADEEADRDAPGELFRRSSHAKQCEDGKGDAAVDPVVMDLRGTLVGDAEVGFFGVH